MVMGNDPASTPDRRAGSGRFAEARQTPAPDQIDVVLAEWASERPEHELAPVAITARLSRLAQILQQRMERVSSRFGLDWGQFLVLASLRGAGRPFRMSPRELHKLLLLSPAAVTNRLYRLEAKGLIERTADPSDGRSLPVILTVQGLSTIERAMAACLESERELLAGIETADMDVTLRTLRQLLSAYEDYPSRRRRRPLALAREPELPEGVVAPPVTEVDDMSTPAPISTTMWPDSHRDLERLQRKLSRRVEEVTPWAWSQGSPPAVGGVFVSLPTGRRPEDGRDIAWAAAVVMEGHEVVATATATRELLRPYQSGYLALTVGPILEDVVNALSLRPDIIIVNAAGRDHPRGAGLALQLGAALDVPTIGVTDRPLVGSASEPGGKRGDWTPVRVDSSLVGFRLRTLSRGNSVTAHAAWATTAEVARDIVLNTTGRTRVPEPVQRARQLSRRLRNDYERSAGTGFQDGIHG